MRLRVPCPAKVNLFLAVGPADARGYHPIRTVYQAVGLLDVLTIELSEQEDHIESDWQGMPEDNTVAKALRLVRELAPVPRLHVFVEKRITPQSGLGGGSSDAAGLLRAIPHLIGGPVPEPFLCEVAAAVGKDVPFFLVGGKARGEGYGELLVPLDDGPPVWFAIARPEAGCSTSEAYTKLDASPRDFLPFPEDGGLYNDFERVAPEVSLDLIESLQAFGATGALLCGSGSAVFGVFEDEAQARQAVHRLQQGVGVTAWAAPALTREASCRVERLDASAPA